MSKIVNLRKIRKAKARTEATARADTNAARHGRSRAEREAEAKTADAARRALDGHRRDEVPDT